ncbi:MAG: hypothetical protein K0B16_06095 [Burkholderiaceae bacterium]|nr:hypothetical protein [Burkholderiaceae bacterium]
MNATKLLAIALIVGGLLGLAYGGFSYTRERQVVDVGPIHLKVDEQERVNIPLWAGLGAIAGGLLLLVTSRKS